MSIGTGDCGIVKESRVGELRDVVDAKESSKSEDRNSLTSSLTRVTGCMLDENWGTWRTWVEGFVFAKRDGMTASAERCCG